MTETSTVVAPRKTSSWRFDFHGADERDARQKAEAYLKAAGFSVASRQRGAPSGIMFGDYLVAKWRNLSTAEREALHGKMFADHLPVTVQFPASPVAIDDAIFDMHLAITADDLAARAARAESAGK